MVLHVSRLIHCTGRLRAMSVCREPSEIRSDESFSRNVLHGSHYLLNEISKGSL